MEKRPPRAMYLTRRGEQYFLTRDRKLERIYGSYCSDFEFVTGVVLREDEQVKIHIEVKTLRELPDYVAPPPPEPISMPEPEPEPNRVPVNWPLPPRNPPYPGARFETDVIDEESRVFSATGRRIFPFAMNRQVQIGPPEVQSYLTGAMRANIEAEQERALERSREEADDEIRGDRQADEPWYTRFPTRRRRSR